MKNIFEVSLPLLAHFGENRPYWSFGIIVQVCQVGKCNNLRPPQRFNCMLGMVHLRNTQTPHL